MKQTRIAAALIALQTIAALFSFVYLAVWTEGIQSGFVQISSGFALAVLLADLSWLISFVLIKRTSIQPSVLHRLQPTIAWLIYHSAAVSLWLLTFKFDRIALVSWFMIQLALVVMGGIPIGSMIWLEKFWQKKMSKSS